MASSGMYDIGDGDALASPPPGGVRSVFERMTNPTPQDMSGLTRLKQLGPVELERVILQFIQIFEAIGKQRDDVDVKSARDPKGWTIRVNVAKGV